MKADFQSISQQALMFAESSRTQPVAITIMNDALPETNETLRVSLHRPVVLVDGVDHPLTGDEASRIQIQPATATIEIQDNDGKCTKSYYILPLAMTWLGCHVTFSSSGNK